MKVLVCGGRHYSNMALVFGALHDLHAERRISAVIHGGATGADSLANTWAELEGVGRIVCPANWATYGKRAGPLRNREMLQLKPDVVLAFPGGRGTADMVRAAKEAGVPVNEIGKAA